MKEKEENPKPKLKGKKKKGARLSNQAKEILYGPRLSQLKGLNQQLKMIKENYNALKMSNNPYSPLNNQFAFPQYNPLRQEQQISVIRAQANNALEKAQTDFNKRLAETQSQFLARLEETEKLKVKGFEIGPETESKLYEEVSYLDPEKAFLKQQAFALGGKTTKDKRYKNEYGGLFFTDAQVKRNPILANYFKKSIEPIMEEEQEEIVGEEF
jgi:hypothetical protein